MDPIAILASQAIHSIGTFLIKSHGLLLITMRLLSLLTLGSVAAGAALAQSPVEPKDFDPAEALLANGVDASIIENLEKSLNSTLVARTTPCSVAVCTHKFVLVILCLCLTFY